MVGVTVRAKTQTPSRQLSQGLNVFGVSGGTRRLPMAMGQNGERPTLFARHTGVFIARTRIF